MHPDNVSMVRTERDGASALLAAALEARNAALKGDVERLTAELATERAGRIIDQGRIAERYEQLAAARLAADKATVELVSLAQRLAAIVEAKAIPPPRRGRLGRAWRWFLRN
jgi:hypothetical protein